MERVETTFWLDFSIADKFGLSAIKDTYRRAFDCWKNDYRYLTELVMVLNHKIWEHYEKGNKQKSKLYNDLWIKADAYAINNLKDDELMYFYMVTDQGVARMYRKYYLDNIYDNENCREELKKAMYKVVKKFFESEVDQLWKLNGI